MTPAMAELLNRYRRVIRDMDQQVAGLEGGAFRMFHNGEDVTSAALERVKTQRAELQALVDKHDPGGWTILRDALPKSVR